MKDEKMTVINHDQLTQLVNAADVCCWESPNAIHDQGKVDAIKASMDADPDRYIWDGPPLIADVDCQRLLTGSHRQAALQALHEQTGVDGWGIPVIDIADLTDEDTCRSRVQSGEDYFAVVCDLMQSRDDLEQLGWDIEA